MIYLSRMILDPRDARANRDMRNPYALHQRVLMGFPETLPEDERVLWRLEDRNGRRPVLLVQSHWTMPVWSVFGTQDWRGYLQRQPETKSIELSETVSVGDVLAFRLRANPTICIRGQRRGLYREEDQRSWLLKVALPRGFRVRDVRITHSKKVVFTRRKSSVTLSVAQYEGLIEVLDIEPFLSCVECGVGRARAFGLGLLSVVPYGQE